MAFTWKLGESTHDLEISSKGKLKVVYGADEVKQRIICTLKHFWNEYFLNVYAGIPWNEVILGSRDTKTAELIIRSAVLDVPGTISISSFESDFSNATRQLSIYMIIEVQGYEGTLNNKYIDIYFAASPNEFTQESNLFASTNWMFAEGSVSETAVSTNEFVSENNPFAFVNWNFG